MVTRLRERLGSAGLIVAVVALVTALGGGAYAATSGPLASTSSHRHRGSSSALTAKQKREVERIAKGLRAAGPEGKQGPQGQQGAVGATGERGPRGERGLGGEPGERGEEGEPGESIESFVEPTGTANCEGRGGTKFIVGPEATYACNGEAGEPGEPGPRGEKGEGGAGGVLKEGETETGGWAISGSGEGLAFAAISFTIPLEAALAASAVHYSTQGDFETYCKGSVDTPTAPSKTLCVYQGGTIGASFAEVGSLGSAEGASTAGAKLVFETTEEIAFGFGSWAVSG